MHFTEHQVTKPQLGGGQEGQQMKELWRNHHNIGGSKNLACQVLWYFFAEETSSHFPLEGLETKAKIWLKFFDFLKQPTHVCTYSGSISHLPLPKVFGGEENVLFWGCKGHNQVNLASLECAKHSFGSYEFGKCVYSPKLILRIQRVFYVNLEVLKC